MLFFPDVPTAVYLSSLILISDSPCHHFWLVKSLKSGPFVLNCSAVQSAGSSGRGSDGRRPKSLPTYHGGDRSEHGEESLGRWDGTGESNNWGEPRALNHSPARVLIMWVNS